VTASVHINLHLTLTTLQ